VHREVLDAGLGEAALEAAMNGGGVRLASRVAARRE
jgi:hypothetical protein